MAEGCTEDREPQAGGGGRWLGPRVLLCRGTVLMEPRALRTRWGTCTRGFTLPRPASGFIASRLAP